MELGLYPPRSRVELLTVTDTRRAPVQKEKVGVWGSPSFLRGVRVSTDLIGLGFVLDSSLLPIDFVRILCQLYDE